jgi:hypothetical protein
MASRQPRERCFLLHPERGQERHDQQLFAGRFARRLATVVRSSTSSSAWALLLSSARRGILESPRYPRPLISSAFAEQIHRRLGNLFVFSRLGHSLQK